MPPSAWRNLGHSSRAGARAAGLGSRRPDAWGFALLIRAPADLPAPKILELPGCVEMSQVAEAGQSVVGIGGWGIVGLMETVGALFVDEAGCYAGLDGVEVWGVSRDARMYAGPHPVVAHPPCERWGRFWHGSTRKPHQFRLGADGGCFAAALGAVIQFGGVLEHPEHSRAWGAFDLPRPAREGWSRVGLWWVCRVEQGFYGHFSRKPTWLLARLHRRPPELRWGRGEQRLHPVALAKHGYEKARRIGMVAMVGGKDKKRIRDATPVEFRDVLLSIVRSCVIMPQVDCAVGLAGGLGA